MDGTHRFNDRATDYQRARPGYPKALIALLLERFPPSKVDRVVDIGAGTGKLTAMLLDAGYEVCAVEPSRPMREAADRDLSKHRGYSSIASTAEDTRLPSDSVDLIVSAQAFHWFDVERCRQEFSRIANPGASCALIWNHRSLESAFARAYDAMLHQYCDGYANSPHRQNVEMDVERFFAPSKPELFEFVNPQHLRQRDFLARLFSASYTPKRHSAEGEELARVATALWERYAQDEEVVFEQVTRAYLGALFT